MNIDLYRWVRPNLYHLQYISLIMSQSMLTVVYPHVEAGSQKHLCREKSGILNIGQWPSCRDTCAVANSLELPKLVGIETPSQPNPSVLTSLSKINHPYIFRCRMSICWPKRNKLHSFVWVKYFQNTIKNFWILLLTKNKWRFQFSALGEYKLNFFAIHYNIHIYIHCNTFCKHYSLNSFHNFLLY